MAFFYWGALNWTQYSKCGLNSAEQKGNITSLNLLATLFLTQPKTVVFFAASAYCLLMFNPLSTETCMSFSVKLISAQLVPSLYWCMGLFTKSFVQDFAFPFVELHEAHVSPIFQPIKVPPSGHSSQFCIISKLAEGAVCPGYQ